MKKCIVMLKQNLVWVSVYEIPGNSVLCRWFFLGIEYFFSQLEALLEIEGGYMVGTLDHHTYSEVKTSQIGHLEVVKVFYDSV